MPHDLRGTVLPVQRLTPDLSACWEQITQDNVQLANPFYSPHYAMAVGACRSHVYVCILTRGSEPVGFLPFQFPSAWHRSLGFAERAGGVMTDAFGLVAGPGTKLSEQELLRAAGLQALSFTHLQECQRVRGLSGEQPSTGLRIQLHERYWSDLEAAKRSALRETERVRRQLERAYGPLRFCFDQQDGAEELTQLLDRKGHQYVRTGRQNLFSLPWARQLLQKLAGLRQPSCQGVLSTLYAGDTWVASHFGLRHTHVLQYWFPVYNPELKRYAPGRQLEYILLRHALDAGITLIDHAEGDTLAKRFFANEEYSFYRGLWTRSGARSTLARLTFALEWRIASSRRQSSPNGSP